MATLPTNFKDDILDTSVNTRRKYRMYENADGTVEFEDVTEYSQVGSEFGAGQINDINEEVNQKFDKNMVVRDLNTIGAITKEGYVPDALAFKEVYNSLEELKNSSSSNNAVKTKTVTGTTSSQGSLSLGINPTEHILLSVSCGGGYDVTTLYNSSGYHCRVLESSTSECKRKPNTSVTVEVVYMDRV